MPAAAGLASPWAALARHLGLLPLGDVASAGQHHRLALVASPREDDLLREDLAVLPAAPPFEGLRLAAEGRLDMPEGGLQVVAARGAEHRGSVADHLLPGVAVHVHDALVDVQEAAVGALHAIDADIDDHRARLDHLVSHDAWLADGQPVARTPVDPASIVGADAPPEPRHYRRLKRLNAAGAHALTGLPTIPALALDRFRAIQEKGAAQLVDTRHMLAFGGGHIPGAINYEPGPKPFTQATDLLTLPADSPFVIYCYTGQTSAYLSGYLRTLGYDAKTLLFGANAMFFDTMPGSRFVPANEVMDYDLETT